MVTRYITALEEWVGVSLFQRTTRKVSVTPGDEIYFEKSKQIQNIAFDIEVNSKATDAAPLEEFSFNSQFSSNETLLIQEAAFEGMGIATLPLALVKTSIEQKRLVQVLPYWELPKIGLHIVFTNRKFIGPQVRLLIDYLSEKARQQIW